MLRDPWQVGEESPYDVLGIEPGAADREVTLALQRLTAAGGGSGPARDAWRELRDPTARAFHDLFHYDVETLTALVPMPLDAAVLDAVAGRAQLEQHLVAIQRAELFDPAATHALLVLHYWSARYTELHPDLAPSPAGGATWQRVIGHVVLLRNLEPFWQRWAGVHCAADIEQVRQRLDEHLPALFHRSAERLRASGAAGLAEGFERCALAVELEAFAATALAAVREPLHLGNRPVRLSCGPLLLDYMGWRTEVLGQLRAAAAVTGRSDLQGLAVALSPLGPVLALFRARRTEAAYQELLRSSEEDRHSDEGVALAIPLGAERARELALAGDLKGAFGVLTEVARGRPVAQMKAEIGPIVESLLSTWATALLEQPDQAVEVLEQSVAMTDSPRAASLLAGVLHRRAQQRVAAVAAHGSSENLAPHERDELFRELSLARIDLDRASRRIAQAGDLLAEVEQRLRDWPRPCWFCTRRLSDPGAVWAGPIRRGAETDIVRVPRCRHCRARHRVVADWSRWGTMIGALVGAMVGCAAGGGNPTPLGFVGTALGVAAGGAAGLVAGAAFGHVYRMIERVSPESRARSSPEYQACLRDGWRIGSPPAR